LIALSSSPRSGRARGAWRTDGQALPRHQRGQSQGDTVSAGRGLQRPERGLNIRRRWWRGPIRRAPD